jgi:protein TonB
MGQLDLISNPRRDKGRPRRLRAFLASCAFHGLLIGSLVGLSFLYRSHLPPMRSGSAPGAPALSLETMVIVSPPPQPPAPQPPKPTPAVGGIPALPAPAPTVAATTPPPKPEAKPAPPEGTVPVLAIQPGKPVQALQPTAVKTRSAIHPAISPAAAATTQSSPPKPAVAASPSNYAPGPSVLPHPPYPTEARDRGQAGTVIMNVQFDVKGDVAHAEVAQSSGMPLLDAATRSFIRAHWHSPAYAGQAVSVPVQYKLENL